MTDDLHKASFLPDLLVAALNRHPDRPAVYLGDQVLTGREVAAQMSCYAQAYAAQGLDEGQPGLDPVAEPSRGVVRARGQHGDGLSRRARCTRSVRSTTTRT